MRHSAALPLQRHHIFATRNPEEARAFLRLREYRLDISAREAAHFDTQINGFFLPGLYLGSLRYGAAVELRTDPSYDDHRLVIPLRGRLEAAIARDAIACGPGTAILLSPTLGRSIRAEHGNAGLSLFLKGSALRRQLVALLGEAPKAPLEFAPAIALGGGYGRSLLHYVRSAIADLEEPAPLLNPITTSLFEQFLMTGLLLAHPHTYSEALRRPQRAAASRDVKRAIDFIEASLDAPIGLPDIAAAAGVPGRTLLEHFKQYRGVSPMEYLRRARFAKVQQTLQRAEPEENVTGIALRFGFSHMGRFSVEYRRRFGESPSQTLRQRRNPSPAGGSPSWSGRLQ
ncbi:MAG TPA: AraC family transcriptional regulator [Stellaceae bacterium]|nr:AraC family transcriptional regulator [Stellaceae bacterium]